MSRGLAVLLLMLPALAAAGQPAVELESRVVGNRELPRVMHIVPWRQSAGIEFDWEPEPVIADELFRQLRRDEYRRELHYRTVLTSPAAGGQVQTLSTTQPQGN